MHTGPMQRTGMVRDREGCGAVSLLLLCGLLLCELLVVVGADHDFTRVMR